MTTIQDAARDIADVLLQLLPPDGYETARDSLVDKDVYAHALMLATAQLDADYLLELISGIPTQFLNEFEADYGLPAPCMIAIPSTPEARRAVIAQMRNLVRNYTRAGMVQLFAMFGITLVEVVRRTPASCVKPCTQMINIDRNRYRLGLVMQAPVQADTSCIIEHYLPTALDYALTII